MKSLNERIEFLNILEKTIQKSKISLFNGDLGDYQKEINLVNQGIELLFEDYKENLMEAVPNA